MSQYDADEVSGTHYPLYCRLIMKLDAIVSAMFSLVIIAGVWCHFSPCLITACAVISAVCALDAGRKHKG